MPKLPNLERFSRALAGADLMALSGRVTQVIGLVIEANGPPASIGELCTINIGRQSQQLYAEVVGFREGKVLLMPLGEMAGIRPGSEVIAHKRRLSVAVGDDLLGRVIDGLGRPMDNRGPVLGTIDYSVSNRPPSPLERKRIDSPLSLGIRAIDSMLTCGKGQRIGIFSGSGVGKSTLLGMIARNTQADVNVIGLIGERGREVRDFLERDLGAEGLARSVVVVATADEPALLRIKGALVATTIAEYFRDQGFSVNLMMDSVTRFATAQREVGLAIGEPPTTRAYTPSVFAELPKLLERAGTNDKGSITGLYTVLVEADDMNEPVADAARAILDGHIVLSRELASANHFPAIDILESVSRVMPEVITKGHNSAASKVRDIMASYKRSADLINIGAYAPGSNPRVDLAIAMIDDIRSFLRQDVNERASLEDARDMLFALVGEAPDEDEAEFQLSERAS